METIYIDSFSHCHRYNDGTMREIQTDFFVGKCDAVVEGYCFDGSKGYVQVYPWKPYSELAAAQSQYETMLSDMDNAYREGVISA